jgi:hypothetical protein
VNGFVDDHLRALRRVLVSASLDGERRDLVAWIDTAFNGGLAMPRKQVADLGLSKQSLSDRRLDINYAAKWSNSRNGPNINSHRTPRRCRESWRVTKT